MSVVTGVGVPGRSGFLDCVRGAACCAILVYHLNRSRPAGLGQAAMELFFVLSGYLIAKSLASAVERNGARGVWHFTMKRTRRLLPGMAAFIVGAVVLNLVLHSAAYRHLATASLASMTGWYNFLQCYLNPPVAGFGGVWSLSLEEQFYLSAVILVLLCRLCSKRKLNWLLFVGLSLSVVGFCFRLAAYCNLYQPESTSILAYLPPLRMWGFGLGALTAAIESSPRIRYAFSRWGVYTAIVSMIALVLVIRTVQDYNARAFMFQWAAVPVFGALLILSAARMDRLLLQVQSRRSLEWVILVLVRPLSALGLASYSIYLWHCLIISAFELTGNFGSRRAWWLMASLSVVSGVVAWRYVECRFYSFSSPQQRPVRTLTGVRPQPSS